MFSPQVQSLTRTKHTHTQLLSKVTGFTQILRRAAFSTFSARVGSTRPIEGEQLFEVGGVLTFYLLLTTYNFPLGSAYRSIDRPWDRGIGIGTAESSRYLRKGATTTSSSSMNPTGLFRRPRLQILLVACDVE